MDRSNRPVGREKRTGAGVGRIFRRGQGVSGQTGGPVGEAGGYSDKTGAAPQPAGGAPATQVEEQAHPLGSPAAGASGAGGAAPSGGAGGPSMPGGPSSGGRRTPGLGCSPRLLLIALVIVAVIAVVVYLATRGSGGGTEDTLGSATTVSTSAVPSTVQNSATTPTTVATSGTVATSVSQQARGKRTVLKGNGNDRVTIMVYMCGTDLESKSGMATADLNEMLYANDSDKLNIIVETGGTARWRNSVISNATNQRWRVTPQGLQLVQDNLGRRSMVDPATLSDFIQYCKGAYPADRYMLVFWDHGGGSLTGYGYDENVRGDSMTLDEVATALKNGGCVFDVIGFDACLMAALESAIVLEPHADYMIASEETEPGIGWYYTDWLSTLAANTSTPTTDLGKKLIDDYVAHCQSQTPQSQATLSLVDLAELKGTVPSAFASFATSANGLIDTEQYQTISDARADAKEFASSSQINQVDLIDFANRMGTPEAAKLVEVLRGCIKYNRTSNNIANANGLSIFFPYSRLSQLNSMLATYDRIGIPAEYSQCVRSYASVAGGGQVTSAGGGSILDVLLGGLAGGGGSQGGGQGSGSPAGGSVGSLLESFLGSGDFSGITGLVGGGAGWLDTGKMQAYQGYYEANRFDASALTLATKNGQRVIALSEEQWALVQRLEQNVFIDDGEGFIDLGLDNVFEFNADGDLIMEYDGTWLALNGQIVSYYMVSADRDGERESIRGRVPALLNGQLVDIIVVFDDENPGGVVLGAQPKYDTETETGTVAKGLVDIVAGDTIDYLCDYYTYDGDYTNTYYLGEQYTATGAWTVKNLSVGDLGYQMTYRLTDIYGNHYWTPSISD